MNVLKRCIYGFSILSLALISVQCKGNQKEEKEEKTTQKMESVSIERKEYGTTPAGQKVDVYTNACDEAVLAGRTLQQYYVFGSGEYGDISQKETVILKNENDVRTSYNKLKSGNEDLQSLISIGKFLVTIGAI